MAYVLSPVMAVWLFVCAICVAIAIACSDLAVGHSRFWSQLFARSGDSTHAVITVWKSFGWMTRLEYESIYSIFTVLCIRSVVTLKRVGPKILYVALKRTVCDAYNVTRSWYVISGLQRIHLAEISPQHLLLLQSTLAEWSVGNRKISFARPARSSAAYGESFLQLRRSSPFVSQRLRAGNDPRQCHRQRWDGSRDGIIRRISLEQSHMLSLRRCGDDASSGMSFHLAGDGERGIVGACCFCF